VLTVFLFCFFILLVKKNTSSCLHLGKHLLILEILQEAASEFPTLVPPQRELETSNQPLKKPNANQLPVILKSNTKTRFRFFFKSFTTISSLRNNLQNHRRLPECRNKKFGEGFSKDLQN
jgi:hypothetical protein